MYIYTHTYIHICVSTYLCMCVCEDRKKKKGRKMAILQVFVGQVIKEDRLETFAQELKLQ